MPAACQWAAGCQRTAASRCALAAPRVAAHRCAGCSLAARLGCGIGATHACCAAAVPLAAAGAHHQLWRDALPAHDAAVAGGAAAHQLHQRLLHVHVGAPLGGHGCGTAHGATGGSTSGGGQPPPRVLVGRRAALRLACTQLPPCCPPALPPCPARPQATQDGEVLDPYTSTFMRMTISNIRQHSPRLWCAAGAAGQRSADASGGDDAPAPGRAAGAWRGSWVLPACGVSSRRPQHRCHASAARTPTAAQGPFRVCLPERLLGLVADGGVLQGGASTFFQLPGGQLAQLRRQSGWLGGLRHARGPGAQARQSRLHRLGPHALPLRPPSPHPPPASSRSTLRCARRTWSAAPPCLATAAAAALSAPPRRC